jgi:hypothetical protein
VAGGRIVTLPNLNRNKCVSGKLLRRLKVLADPRAASLRNRRTVGKQREKAIASLHAIDDPTVIPAIESCLHRHQEGFGEELAKLLITFPQHEATQSLVRFAVVSPYLSVRDQAIEELKKRPLHDYVPTLLAGLIAPLRAQYQFQTDARGSIRYQQVFKQEQPDTTLVRYLEQLYRPQVVQIAKPGGMGKQKAAVANWYFDALIQSDVEIEITRLRLLTNASRLAADHQNDRVIDVLAHVTGQQLPREAEQWWKWWQEYNQVHYPKPVRRLYAYSVRPYLARAGSASCFAKGTVVWTERGLLPIETIEPGDRVLSQEPDSGELAFKVVTDTTVRPPAEASTLSILGESITTTLGHPLWVTGQGWEMAKQVKPGDQLHGVHGVLVVSTIDRLPNKIEAHNLIVEDFGTYFVGNCGVLVHDNTYRKPTQAVVPGLVP